MLTRLKYKEIIKEARNMNEMLKNRFINNYLSQKKLNLEVKTLNNAIEIIKKIDVKEVLGLKIENGKNFKCMIIEDNIASVNTDKAGNYYYFTRTRDAVENVGIDLISLVEIAYNINYYSAVRMLCKMFNLKIKEDEFMLNNKIKYANNIEVIENAEFELINYKNLYKYISKHLWLLEKMQCFALANIQTKKEAKKDDNIFFCSTRFLEEWFKKQEIEKSKTLISNLLNAFCALGLMSKVKLDELPKKMQQKAVSMMDKDRFNVNFYIIEEYTQELLLEADKRAGKLLKAKVSATKVTAEKTEKVLGKRIVDKVFLNKEKQALIVNIKDYRSGKMSLEECYGDYIIDSCNLDTPNSIIVEKVEENDIENMINNADIPF